jgi:hypothetical protein
LPGAWAEDSTADFSDHPPAGRQCAFAHCSPQGAPKRRDLVAAYRFRPGRSQKNPNLVVQGFAKRTVSGLQRARFGVGSRITTRLHASWGVRWKRYCIPGDVIERVHSADSCEDGAFLLVLNTASGKTLAVSATPGKSLSVGFVWEWNPL